MANGVGRRIHAVWHDGTVTEHMVSLPIIGGVSTGLITTRACIANGDVAKEIESECADESGEPLNETVANMLIAANYGFWAAIFVKAAIGIGIPMVLGIIRAVMKNSGRARKGKNAFANAKRELDALNRQMR